jgi:hypothetical protein
VWTRLSNLGVDPTLRRDRDDMLTPNAVTESVADRSLCWAGPGAYPHPAPWSALTEPPVKPESGGGGRLARLGERTRLPRRFAGHGLDQGRGYVAQLAVAILGDFAEHRESIHAVDASLSHDDADGLVDDDAGGQRLAKLFLQQHLVGVLQYDGECGACLIGERFAVPLFDDAEAVDLSGRESELRTP